MRHKQILLILLCLGFALVSSLPAANSRQVLSGKGIVAYQPEIRDPLAETWRWHAMDMLSAKGVRSMTDDAAGNMWFGLNKGIIRYDGYQWTLFNEEFFLNHPVSVLFSAEDQLLYAGSETGLLRWDNQKWQKIFPKTDSLHIAVSAIRGLRDGSGILAGIQNGLLLLTPDHTYIFTILSRASAMSQAMPEAKIIILPDELLFQRNFGRIDELYQAADGKIWMFMSRNNDGKLLKFHMKDTLDGVLQHFSISENLDGHKLSNRNQILETPNGKLWLINGFYKSGMLVRAENKKWQSLKLSDRFGGDELHTDIIGVSDGSVWIGGLGKLFVWKAGQWKVYAAPAIPLPSSRILIHESRNGQLWIAGVQGDVFRLNYHQQKWITYRGLNFQFRDPAQRDWFISVDNRVVVKDQELWQAFDQASGLIDAPTRMIITRAGRIWVAGSHQGIAATAYLENNQWIKQLHPKLSWGIDPRSVFQDQSGALWFGASVDRQENLGQISGILQLSDPDSQQLQWHHHTQNDGIVQHNVYGIGQSPDGSIWAGGTNLIRYTPPRWQTLAEIEQLNEFVDIVHSKTNLWAGSRYYGIYQFDGQHWRQFTKNDGLPSNTIISIFEVGPQEVWAITDKDIALFDGTSWNSGLFPEEFRIPREGGDIQVTSDGAIWINKALREWKRRAFPFSITPSVALEDFWTVRYQRSNHAPMTNIEVYTEKVDQSGNTLISWSGQDYWEETPAHLLEYAWRINQGSWSAFSPETSVVLTNLKSGKYQFEVRARNLEGNIEESPAQVSFWVSPPIWKQPWFMALVLSFLIVIAIYETRVIRRNKRLSNLNQGLQTANETLEARQQKIELQKEKILQQKEELERKALVLGEKNEEIIKQRDQLQHMVEKVESLSNVKQRFFTNISHEFRTPLTLILGSIEKLLRNPGEQEKPEIKQVYETIQRNSRRILRLINQILEIRKIETGKLELQPTPGDIVHFIREITQLFQDLALNQKINLEFHCSYPCLPLLFDRDKLEKILFNLLSNAFKATPAGGLIVVNLDKIRVGDNPDEKVVISVKDTGKGIPAERLETIFDRFYQVSETTIHHHFDSSGIGLSYVRDLVQIHQGTISVKSQPNKGSAFTFEIPYHGVEASARGCLEQAELPSMLSSSLLEEVKSIKHHKGFTVNETIPTPEIDPNSPDMADNLVLIVEDEPELRVFIRQILEPHFKVLEAENGQVGFDLAQEYQPDIIITDVMMPEMNGIEMCQRLKAARITNHIPVIMLTARTSPEQKLEGYQLGADAYLEKPFNLDYLKVRINNLLQSRDLTREKVMRDLITQPSEIEVDSEDDKMLRKIREVLEENIANSEFDVESLSQQFFLSRCHFTRKIKQITGLSPKEIIDSYRLKRAGQILRQQKVSISEVAYMVGFDHPNSFSRAFRKYYKMSPSEFSIQN